MAQKKTAKKAAKKAAKTAKKTATSAAAAKSKKATAKAASKTTPTRKTAAKATAKSAAKTVKKAPAVKKSAAKTGASRSGGADSQVGEQLRQCLENGQLTDQDLFGTVARLLHDNLGYSALNFFRNVDPQGRGGNFELLAATGEDPTLLYYADEPGGAPADGTPPAFRVKFAGRPVANDILDESSGLRAFTLPGPDDAEAGPGVSGSPEGYPLAIHALPAGKDASLSILYLPFGTPESADAISGFVAAVLINPRPRYTKSDFEPAALIASLLRRNLMRFRLSEARAQNEASLAALRSEAGEKQQQLADRLKVLEEQTGDQHRIRKELEGQLTDERQAAAKRQNELETALSDTKKLSEQRQAELDSGAEELAQLRQRTAELEGTRGNLEVAHAAELARQKSEYDALLESNESDLRAQLAKRDEEIANFQSERDNELTKVRQAGAEEREQLSRDLAAARTANEDAAERARSEQANLETRATTAEATKAELESRVRDAEGEIQNLQQRLKELQDDHRTEVERLSKEHDTALSAASSGTESRVQTLKSEYEQRLKDERAGAESNLQKREAELRDEIARMKTARDDVGAERELLTEELEKNAAQLQEAGAESQALSARIEKLQQEIEAGSRERSALDERAANLDEELARERQSRAESERVNASRGEENKRLQDQLAARIGEVQELQRDNQTVTRELEELKTNLGSRDQALKQEQQQSAERQQRLTELEEQLAETQRNSEEQAASYEQLLQEGQQKQATTEGELQKARANIEQKETDYHNALYELKQKVNTLTETLERTRTEARAGEAERAREVEELKSQSREMQNKHEREIADRENRAQDLSARLSQQHEETARLGEQLQSERDALRDSKQSGETLRGEIGTLQTRIAELGENHTREIARLEDAAKSRESETAREIANRDGALQIARGTIETHEKRLETLERDLSRLREDKGQLQQKLGDAGRLEKGLREELGAAAKKAGEQDGLIAKRKNEIDVLTGERNTAREEGARLRQDIGIRREREARLEQAIAGLKEDIHGLNNRLSEANQKERELDNNIAGLRNSLQSTRSELSEQYQKERKLGEELNAALAREKGSEEEGRLLANLTNAISNLPAFTDKIRYLRENVPGRADIERVVVYRLTDEDTLLFQDGYHGECRLESLRGRRVRLQDTTFGQALVNLRPRRLETGDKLKNPDLPDGLDQALAGDGVADAELRSFLCLPLMESESGIGIMVIASTRANAFDDKHIRILGNIAPLFAVAVQFERNNAELQLHRTRIHNFKQVTHYQERRYLKAAGHLHRLSTRILPVLRGEDAQKSASEDGGVGEDLLRELDDYSQLTLPGSLQNAVDFLQWVETLGARVASGANLSFEHDLDMEKLGRFAGRIGSGFQNLYWLVAEALENVARHSQATRLEIALGEENDGRFRFSVIDNGEGLVRTAGTDKPEHGSGLRAIANLAEAAGGHAIFARDANGHGLAVHIDWDPDENDLDATLRESREIPVA